MKPTRPWLQYLLRSSLVLLAAFAVWLGVVVYRARQQREAVETIRELGGFVFYDWECREVNGLRALDPNRRDGPGGPAWLRRIVGNDFFQEAAIVAIQDSPEWEEIKADMQDALPNCHFVPLESSDASGPQ